MGANSKQGWALFAFMVGFTFLPAGLVYLGPVFTLLGLILIIGSAVTFYQIKPLEHAASPEQEAPQAMKVVQKQRQAV